MSVPHYNIYNCDEFREVYSSLQKEYKRDQYKQYVYEFILTVLLVLIFFFDLDSKLNAFLIYAAIFIGYSALKMFSDNSNRNWHMHLIDYLEENKNDRKRI